MLMIANILTSPECEAIRDTLDNGEIWRDGAATAAGAARAVKENEQGDPQSPKVKAVLAKVEMALRANDTFMAAAIPERFARMIVSQYRAGMEYGAHVDAPYIDDARSDISFTLFLSAPDEYQGGELIIERAGHEDTISAPQGSVVLYPSDTVHRVSPVTSGLRVACVGWIKSRVKMPSDRELLFELAGLSADLKTRGIPAELQRGLANIRNNLLRRFGD